MVALSADGRLAVTGCRDGKARIWDVVTGRAVGGVLAGDGAITAVAFSPDARVVVVGDLSFQVRGFDIGGQALGQPVRLTGKPMALAVSRDGRRVLVGSAGDNGARLVDIVAGQPIGPLLLHRDAVLELTFSPDEKQLATGSSGRDGTARLWDTGTGKALGPPVRHRSSVPALGFSADGAFLWTAGLDRQVIRTKLPSPLTGQLTRLYYDTVLRTGMTLGQDNIERVLTYPGWLQLQKRLDQSDSPKAP